MDQMILGIVGGMFVLFGGIIYTLSRGAPSRDATQSDYPNVYQTQVQGGSRRKGNRTNKSRKRR